MNEYDDDSLLARLRAADPAASLPPADPEGVADLLEDVMGETTTRTTESRDTGTHDRSPLTWLVAAAAVLLIVATGAFALVNRDQGTTPSSQPTVTSLVAAPRVDALCIRPNIRVLQAQTIAFRGTLRSTDPAAGTATFEVRDWFRGGPTELVRVTTPDDRIERLVFLGDLVPGRTYLVAAHDGLITGCGFTGPDTPARAALYEQAFGG